MIFFPLRHCPRSHDCFALQTTFASEDASTPARTVVITDRQEKNILTVAVYIRDNPWLNRLSFISLKKLLMDQFINFYKFPSFHYQ